jgi:DNA-binding protein YbaB
MKISLATTLLVIGATNAFAPQLTTRQQSSQLNLFGGGAKDGEKKAGGGMMDQLAMFKKAQELAQKKNAIDKELAEEDFFGESADGKVKATFKFIPVKNPMDPNPDYEAQKFEFDDEWYESASPEDISAAVKEAVLNGVNETNQKVAERYQALQGDLMGAMGGMQGAEPPAEQ